MMMVEEKYCKQLHILVVEVYQITLGTGSIQNERMCTNKDQNVHTRNSELQCE
jgi:hypothetical protein